MSKDVSRKPNRGDWPFTWWGRCNARGWCVTTHWPQGRSCKSETHTQCMYYLLNKWLSVHIRQPASSQRRSRCPNDAPSTKHGLKLPRHTPERCSSPITTTMVRLQTHLARILHLQRDRQKRFPLEHNRSTRLRIPLRKLSMESHVHKRPRLVLQSRLCMLQ